MYLVPIGPQVISVCPPEDLKIICISTVEKIHGSITIPKNILVMIPLFFLSFYFFHRAICFILVTTKYSSLYIYISFWIFLSPHLGRHHTVLSRTPTSSVQGRFWVGGSVGLVPPTHTVSLEYRMAVCWDLSCHLWFGLGFWSFHPTI